MDIVLATNLVFGALLAMLGGMATHLVVRWLSRRDAKNVLISALTAELFNARESLSSSLAGFRDSLRKGDPPTPTTFATPIHIYAANASQLGQLRDYDLIEHVVDVYSSLDDLSKESLRYQGIANHDIPLQQLNAIHMDATITHFKVISLHRKLAKSDHAPPLLLDIESESTNLFHQYHSQIEGGRINEILNHAWSDA
jgi:hypothetical protein